MSSNTRTRKTRTTETTATTTRTLRSVPDKPTTVPVRTDAEDKLWAALHATPNSTAANLSAAAKIGKSTAAKILVKWEGDGSVTRTPGTSWRIGQRAADVWAIAETDVAPDTAADGTEGAPADERAAEDITPAGTTQDESTTAPAVPDRADIPDDATPVEEELTESVDAEPAAVPAPEDAQDSTVTTADTVPEDTEPADAEPASTQVSMPAAATPAAATPDEATPTASGDGKDEKSDRLAPGALRGMVEDWLRDHPGEQAGPTKIAKDLGGKSSGAVSNALDKLVEDGVAVKAQDKPKRFALAPTQQAVAAPPAN